jgi:hypothetical protein
MNEKFRSAKNIVPKQIDSFFVNKTKKCTTEQDKDAELSKLRSALV